MDICPRIWLACKTKTRTVRSGDDPRVHAAAGAQVAAIVLLRSGTKIRVPRKGRSGVKKHIVMQTVNLKRLNHTRRSKGSPHALTNYS